MTPGEGINGRILVVDDDPMARLLVTAVLARAGHAVEEADGGAAALARLREPPPVDFVVLDLEMPGVDGRGVLAGVEADGSRPPRGILVRTGTVDPAEADRLRARGAVGVMDKAAPLEALVRCVAERFAAP